MMASSTTSPSATMEPGKHHGVERAASIADEQCRGEQAGRMATMLTSASAPFEQEQRQHRDEHT